MPNAVLSAVVRDTIKDVVRLRPGNRSWRPNTLLPSGVTTEGPSRAPMIADLIDVPKVCRDVPLPTGTVVQPDPRARPGRLDLQRVKQRRAMPGKLVSMGAGMARAGTTSVARGAVGTGRAATGLAATVSGVKAGAATATATMRADPSSSQASGRRRGSASPTRTRPSPS